MVRVLRRGRFSVYVCDEFGERHHLPHCHVRWPDGDAQVELPTLIVLDGDDLPRAAIDLLRDNVAELRRSWNRIDPGRHMP